MKSLRVKDFSLKHTIESGQIFLYTESDRGYEIIDGESKFRVRQEGDSLLYEGIAEKDLIYFFALDLNLEYETKEFDDEYLLLALEKYWGLRIMRQDFWQCMIGFVCSSASNIPKIQMNMRNIANEFGEGLFPRLGEINNLEKN